MAIYDFIFNFWSYDFPDKYHYYRYGLIIFALYVGASAAYDKITEEGASAINYLISPLKFLWYTFFTLCFTGFIYYFVENSYVNKQYVFYLEPIHSFCSNSNYRDNNFDKDYESQIEFDECLKNKQYREALFANHPDVSVPNKINQNFFDYILKGKTFGLDLEAAGIPLNNIEIKSGALMIAQFDEKDYIRLQDPSYYSELYSTEYFIYGPPDLERIGLMDKTIKKDIIDKDWFRGDLIENIDIHISYIEKQLENEATQQEVWYSFDDISEFCTPYDSIPRCYVNFIILKTEEEEERSLMGIRFVGLIKEKQIKLKDKFKLFTRYQDYILAEKNYVEYQKLNLPKHSTFHKMDE